MYTAWNFLEKIIIMVIIIMLMRIIVIIVIILKEANHAGLFAVAFKSGSTPADERVRMMLVIYLPA